MISKRHPRVQAPDRRRIPWAVKAHPVQHFGGEIGGNRQPFRIDAPRKRNINHGGSCQQPNGQIYDRQHHFDQRKSAGIWDGAFFRKMAAIWLSFLLPNSYEAVKDHSGATIVLNVSAGRTKS